MGRNEDGTGTFAQALAALKRRGCGVLVVGATPDTGLDVCRRFLGNAVTEPRRRVIVLAGGTPGAEERLPGSESGRDGETLRVIDRRGPTRSTATAAATPRFDAGALETDVTETIDALEPDSGFEPAELRVCLDSVGPLLDADGTESARRTLATLCDRIRDRDGMFHAHLPLPYRSDRVAALVDPFDAVVELRPGEQRWHVSEERLTTDWLSL